MRSAYGATVSASLALAAVMVRPATATSDLESMADGRNGYEVSAPLLTIGASIGAYTPVGILDGLGAFQLDSETVRLLTNHELGHNLGYVYAVNGGTITLRGARISYFDIDLDTRLIVDGGLAYANVYGADGELVPDYWFLPEPYEPEIEGPEGSEPMQGFGRFCSSSLIEPEQFGNGRGLNDRIYFAGEEEGGGSNSVGGAVWALNPATGDLWHLPDLGRGAWENVIELDTGQIGTVALLLADDTKPFDFDGDAVDEAAPLYLYSGAKDPGGDFPARNGLRDGALHVWVADNGERTPEDFNTSGTISGQWVAIDNTATGPPSENGVTGFDEYGYPTQGTLWLRAKAVGAFGFSRPEDIATNPNDGTEAVMASTGVEDYVGGADTFGTVYTIRTNFSTGGADLTILYDGDADLTRALRSPDNLDWADDGYILVQEDEAAEFSLSGEPLFGPGAVNPEEAGIIRLDPADGSTLRVATIDRGVVLDASIADPSAAVDLDAADAGAWESSGVVEVSGLFGEEPGTLFLFDVQAHGIRHQHNFNPGSRIQNSDLVEGGQLLWLSRVACVGDIDGDGLVGVTDFLDLVAGWGPNPGHPADLDGDGLVGITDFLDLVAAWGPCP